MSAEGSIVASRRDLLRGGAVAGGLVLGAGLRPAAAGAMSPAAASPAFTASTDYFLRIDGYAGDSTIMGYEDWIVVLSWGFHVTNSGSPAPGSKKGRIAEKPMTIVKNLDPASRPLLEACTSGRRIPTATLAALSLSGAPTQFLKISLSGVLVSSFDQSADYNQSPVEVLTLSYRKLAMSFTAPPHP